MSVRSNKSERIYRPARVGRVATALAFLAGGALLAWVASGSNVPPWLSEFVYDLILRPRGHAAHYTSFSPIQHVLLFVFSLVLFVHAVWWLLPVVLGLPRLSVTNEGLTLKTIFSTRSAKWEGLARFDLEPGSRSSPRQLVSMVDGEAASDNVRRTAKFVIPDAFAIGLDQLVTELNAHCAEPLGTAFVSPATNEIASSEVA